jgi:hypothetical protein
MVLSHLRAHLLIVRQWVLGPAAAGWRRSDVTPSVELKWRNPRNQQVPQFSSNALSEVTLLQNVFISGSLTSRLANVAQSIEAFNDAISQYNSFKLSDPTLYVNVERKLRAATEARFPGVNQPPEDLTKADLEGIIAAAQFSPEESAWCDALYLMLWHAHVTFLGSAAGRPGLFQRLQSLETEFTTHA